MKRAVMISVSVVAIILVTAEFVALLETSESFEALATTPIPQAVPVNLDWQPRWDLNSVETPSSLHLYPLRAGIYEALPYAILLKVPDPVGDNCVLQHPEPLPRMPVRHPKMRVVPVSPIKK